MCVNWFKGRCWKVREKSHRRALMMLVRRTAPFQVETGRWRGVYTLGREFVQGV